MSRRTASPPNGSRRKNVSEFIENTFAMVNECDSTVVDWVGKKSQAFAVKDEEKFTQQLGHFFRHNNFKSFVRQLNHYGFRKMRHDEVHPRPPSPDWAVFYHCFFMKGRKDLLVNIKQKRKEADSELFNELRGEMDDLRAEVQQIPVLQEQIAHLQQQVDMLIHEQHGSRDYGALPGESAGGVERQAKRRKHDHSSHSSHHRSLRAPALPTDDFAFNRSGSDPYVIIRSLSEIARMSSTDSMFAATAAASASASATTYGGATGSSSSSSSSSSSRTTKESAEASDVPMRDVREAADHGADAAPEMCSRMTSLDVMKQLLPAETRNPLVTKLPSNPFHNSSQTPPVSQESVPDGAPVSSSMRISTVRDPHAKLEAEVVPEGDHEHA